jgi:hypothetical protein
MNKLSKKELESKVEYVVRINNRGKFEIDKYSNESVNAIKKNLRASIIATTVHLLEDKKPKGWVKHNLLESETIELMFVKGNDDNFRMIVAGTTKFRYVEIVFMLVCFVKELGKQMGVKND